MYLLYISNVSRETSTLKYYWKALCVVDFQLTSHQKNKRLYKKGTELRFLLRKKVHKTKFQDVFLGIEKLQVNSGVLIELSRFKMRTSFWNVWAKRVDVKEKTERAGLRWKNVVGLVCLWRTLLKCSLPSFPTMCIS